MWIQGTSHGFEVYYLEINSLVSVHQRKHGVWWSTSRPKYTVHKLSWIGIINQIRIVNFLERNWKSNSGVETQKGGLTVYEISHCLGKHMGMCLKGVTSLKSVEAFSPLLCALGGE